MDCVGTIVEVIDIYLIAPFIQQINYLRSSSANVNDLQTVFRKLMARRNDEQSTLKAAENAGQVKTDRASNWFKDVEAIKMKADAMEEEYNQEMCAMGWFVKCWSLYKLSKRSTELKQTASVLLNERFDLAKPPPPKSVIEFEEVIDAIENQPSTQVLLQQMLDQMRDPEIGIIGVFGMGGVGKTTLARKVNNHFIENSCFEIVIMVMVSATPNIRNIQTNIGKRLGLYLSDDSEDDARDKLFDVLRKKKFLLILDDVWRKLELKDVGIPHPRNYKGSKILVTSRSQDACTDMDARKTIKVEPLSVDESWSLFLEKAGQHVNADHIKSNAEKVVRRCKGLPLAIVTVARAMANRHGVQEWENAAREMEQSTIDVRGMKEDVFVPLKFSFDRLEDDMLRSLFLYCACFPEDYNIGVEEILNYCVGEGVANRLGSLTAAKNKCAALVGSLKISCMLEDGALEGGALKVSASMHDMMRELALWITSSSFDSCSKFLIKTGQSFEEAPQANEWLDASRISLMDTKIKELPELRDRCSKLTTLLLRRNGMIRTVPPTDFLQHMDQLSVLDLSYSLALESLPDSLSCLVNLQVLKLRECRRLTALPTLGKLRRLQVLDLYNCRILDQEIFEPESMGGVSDLRYLDVSLTKVSIPAGLISCLFKLEELRLYNSEKIRWRVSTENVRWDERRSNLSSIDVGELSHLTRLVSLDICFKDIIISDWFKPLAQKIEVSILQHCTVIKQDSVQALNGSKNLWFLRIQDCPGLTCVPTHVKNRLEISNCLDLEKVLDGEEEDNQNSFQSLKSLLLKRLPKLERMCVGLAPPNCFSQLSKIDIIDCRRLKMVFTKGMPRLFNSLVAIKIDCCVRMEVIIEEEEEDGEFLMERSNNHTALISPFPKLTTLHLQNLPALTDVCKNHILHCPLIAEVKVDKCPRLKKDPLHIRSSVHGLLVIEGTKWEAKVMEQKIRGIEE